MSKTTTPLWQMLELGYFRRLPPYRAWKRWLSVAFGLGSLIWVGLAAIRHDESPYSSGPMSVGHAQLADQCGKCHGDSWLGVQRLLGSDSADRTMNRACVHCHGTSIDHDATTMTARHQASDLLSSTDDSLVACASCHREHEGVARLNEMLDAECVRCHADLKESLPETKFHDPITSFALDHPEFRLLAERRKDSARIKLNHQVHLRPGLFGPDRRPVQMTCSDCHRAGRSAISWPYGKAGLHEDAGLAPTDSEPHLQGGLMEPIRNSLHCAGCHELNVDPLDQRLGHGGAVPHDSPQAIHTYLWGQLSEYIQSNPDKLTTRSSAGTEMQRPSLTNLPKPEFNRLALEWVEAEVRFLERKLYEDKRTCVLCHEQTSFESGGNLPVIAQPNIPIRWLVHGAFNHEKHRVVECRECHRTAGLSTQTSDVLLPAIQECRQCHAPRRATAKDMVGGVAHGCVLCHTYHRPPSRLPFDDARSIKDIVSAALPLPTSNFPSQSDRTPLHHE